MARFRNYKPASRHIIRYPKRSQGSTQRLMAVLSRAMRARRYRNARFRLYSKRVAGSMRSYSRPLRSSKYPKLSRRRFK